MTNKINLEPEQVRRSKPKEEEKKKPDPPQTTQGTIDRIVDYSFNPSREKIREMTDVSPVQAKLLPQLDIIDTMWDYVVEVSLYRQNPILYKKLFKELDRERPIQPRIIDDFIYRTAQWQKSVRGTNLKSAIDLALAEMETKAGEAGSMFDDFDNE